MTDKNIKFDILIVEDHALTRFGLKTVFETQPYISEILEAENGEQAIEAVKKYKPDVVVLDLGLPDIDGISLAKKIKDINFTSKLVILTSHNSEEEVLGAFAVGANAYCLKEISPERLAKVVLFVYEGTAWLDPGIAQIVLKKFQTSDYNSIQRETFNDCGLTQREKDVLKLIVDGLTNIEIAERLSVSIHTAKAHVCGILQKLAVQDRTQAAIKALKSKII